MLRVAKGATLTGGVSDITIKGGVLQVDGTFKGGNTFINENGTLEGTGTHGVGDVEVRKGGRVIPGSDGAPGSLTIDGGYSSGSEFATLKIQIAGTNPGDFSVLTVDGFASLGGILEPVLLDGFMPKPGDTFDFLFYEDHIGEFASIANQFFGNLQWLITDSDYGDRMVTLEVVSRASPVPDQGSTFVLLTLGLLGLVTCQRQLLRRHA